MLASALRSLLPAKSPARRTHVNLYTTVAELTRTHWRTGAHPAPRSIVRNDEDEDWPEPLVEDDTPPWHEPSDADAAEQSSAPRSHRPFARKPASGPTPAEHRAHRATMKRNFPEGWAPPRKLSREAMEVLRRLHQHDPKTFSTPVLADRFRVSAEAVRRILKSKWEPTREQRAKMAEKERTARGRWREENREKERLEHERQLRENTQGREDKDGFTLK